MTTTKYKKIGRIIDITGKRFGKLLILEKVGINKTIKDQSTFWKCLCDCGNIVIKSGKNIRKGDTQSCGCLNKKERSKKQTINLLGMKFGRLLVVEKSSKKKNGNVYWKCICDCGNVVVRNGCNLRNGDTRSCGCLTKEIQSKRLGIEKGLSSFNAVYSNYEKRAKDKNILFDISKKLFMEITQKPCYYCGCPPQNIKINGHNNGDFVYNGLDKINPLGGYELKNVIACCKICNFMKNTMSLEEFYLWVEKVYNHSILTKYNSYDKI